jgi:hypothetical protein
VAEYRNGSRLENNIILDLLLLILIPHSGNRVPGELFALFNLAVAIG